MRENSVKTEGKENKVKCEMGSSAVPGGLNC